MEVRLGAAQSEHRPAVIAEVPSPVQALTVTPPAEVSTAVAEPAAVPNDASAVEWPDDAVESAFRAEAKERGEVVVPARPIEGSAEPADTKPLPALVDLVNRIPPEVREALEDLFRARFVTVKRVPAKALKH